MNYQIAYLNTYGNAGILAEEIQNELDCAELVDLSAQEISRDADVYLLVFEMRQTAIPLKIMDVLQATLDKNPEDEWAKAMLENFQYSMHHPDDDDLRALRRFINESGI